MEEVTRKRSVRLGIVLALALAAVAFSLPSLCSGREDEGAKEAGDKPSAEAEAKEEPAAEAEEERPGDVWIDLKGKTGEELERAIEAELREMFERMHAIEKRMEEMMRRMGRMEDMREMQRGFPQRWWTPRPRDFEDRALPPELEEWLKELERDFEFKLDGEPFRFGLKMRPGEAFFSLRMDTKETDEAYVYTLDVPGMTKEDVTVELTDDVLSVSGERKERVEEEREGQKVRREIVYGRFERRIPLPEDADTDKITSTCEDGVLTITVPKKEKQAEKSRRIIVHHP